MTRSPVSIHRFEEMSEQPRTRRAPMHPAPQTDPRRETPIPTVPQGEDKTKPGNKAEATGSADDNAPPVLLEAPDDLTRSTQYLWVPLLSPIYLGGSPVSGFWCHRSVSSPVEAFKRFLGQHVWPTQRVLIAGGQLQLGNIFNGAASSATQGAASSPGSGLLNTSTPVYNQMLQERQALLERTFAPFQPRHSRDSRRPASAGGSAHESFKDGSRGNIR
jgi:hypothetical protein